MHSGFSATRRRRRRRRRRVPVACDASPPHHPPIHGQFTAHCSKRPHKRGSKWNWIFISFHLFLHLFSFLVFFPSFLSFLSIASTWYAITRLWRWRWWRRELMRDSRAPCREWENPIPWAPPFNCVISFHLSPPRPSSFPLLLFIFVFNLIKFLKPF